MPTGIDKTACFRDISHPIIIEYLDLILDELTLRKDIPHMLTLVDQLKAQVSTHATYKQHCHQVFRCSHTQLREGILDGLQDLRRIFSQHGASMTPGQMQDVIKYWADNTIFERDTKCQHCGHVEKTTKL